MDAAALAAHIRAFLQREVGVDAGALADGDPLVTSGVLDSAALVRLAAVVERAIGCTIPDADVTDAHFDSIDRILAYAARRSS